MIQKLHPLFKSASGFLGGIAGNLSVARPSLQPFQSCVLWHSFSHSYVCDFVWEFFLMLLRHGNWQVEVLEPTLISQ